MRVRHDIPIVAVGAAGATNHLGESFQIGSVTIDNPSGSWLLVQPISRYVAPGTLGWTAQILPRRASISVNIVAAPTGGVTSAATGGPIVVHTDSEAYADDSGTDYGLQSAIVDLTEQLSIANLSKYTIEHYFYDFTITGGEGDDTFVSGRTNAVVVVQWTLTSCKPGPITYAGLMEVHLTHGVDTDILDEIIVSDDQRNGFRSYQPRAIVIPAGETGDIVGHSTTNGILATGCIVFYEITP